MRCLLTIIQLFALIAAMSGSQPKDRTAGAETQAQENLGALDIRIHPVEGNLVPPAELSMANPLGAKIGRDPRTGQVFSKIPNSSYEAESIADDETGAAGPETRILHLRIPLVGEYTLWVVGTESAAYDLEIRGYDRELSPSHVRFLNVELLTNAVHRYLIQFTGEPGEKTVVVRD